MKKQLIIEHALELFAEKGILDTSVQQITDRCGISKGAFYLTFKSKDELINSLVDEFMTQYIFDNDQLVRMEPKETLLKEFLMSSYQFRQKHQAFSNVYIKEQMHKMNETMLERLLYYDRLLNDVLLRLVEKLYTDKPMNEKYELVYVIKSFMQLYHMFAFQVERELHIDEFVDSISEKIELIATHRTKSFITDDMCFFLQKGELEIEADVLREKMQVVVTEVEHDVIKESLNLLIENLTEAKLSSAIVHGLVLNLEKEPACKEVAYLYRRYMEQMAE